MIDAHIAKKQIFETQKFIFLHLREQIRIF